MQVMKLVPADQYDRMLESYDKAMEELREVKAQLKAMSDAQVDDAARELKLYNLMDNQECDRDTAELLLQDDADDED